MYAIIRTGGKQYQVESGDVLRIEKITGDVGETVELDDILLIADGENIRIGQPCVEGAKVIAKIVEQAKSKKVIVFKKKKRKGYQVKNGHRQLYTAVKIEEVSA